MHIPFVDHVDLNVWVSTLGYIGIAAMIFAETGLFFCFFFPGDSLLFTAGLLASRQVFNIHLLVIFIVTAAFVGYWLGYGFGRRLGNWLSLRPDTWYFKKRYLQSAERFYARHGKKALLMGRLVPAVRTFIPVVAGMVKMPLRLYAVFNFLGALLWGMLVPLLGYFLGSLFPEANRYLLLAVLIIIFLSVLPGIVEWIKNKKQSF